VMGDVTRNISRWEYTCPDCGLADMHPLEIVALQRFRDLSGAPLRIGSGCRCEKHNAEVGGAPGSKHLPQPDAAGYCMAADVHIDGATLSEMYHTALRIAVFRRGGIGVYYDEEGVRLHLDVRRDGPVRFGKLFGENVSPLMVIMRAQEKGL